MQFGSDIVQTIGKVSDTLLSELIPRLCVDCSSKKVVAFLTVIHKESHSLSPGQLSHCADLQVNEIHSSVFRCILSHSIIHAALMM